MDVNKLQTVRVLWCEPETLRLWGIPYDLRPGQQPRDLWRESAAWRGGARADWIQLKRTEVEIVGGRAPGNAYEWAKVCLGSDGRFHYQDEYQGSWERVLVDEESKQQCE